MTDMAALYKKPFWQKIIIYGAGVVMNLILAMALFALMFAKGFEDNAPFDARIGWISPENQFASSPLRAGDRIDTMNGIAVANHEDLDQVLFDAVKGTPLDQLQEPVEIVYGLTRATQVEGEPETYTFTVTLSNDPRLHKDFGAAFYRRDAYVDFVIPNSPAEKGGIRRGDTVLSIDEEKIQDWSHFVSIVSASPNKALQITVLRNGEPKTIEVTPWENAEVPGLGQIGVQQGNAKKVVRSEPLLTALGNSPVRVWNFALTYAERLGALGGKVVTGNVRAASRELSGPAGIAQVAYKMSQHGFDDWLRFVIMLNVALAVMNILPFPVLDGGHICFAIFEAIFPAPRASEDPGAASERCRGDHPDLLRIGDLQRPVEDLLVSEGEPIRGGGLRSAARTREENGQ
jgi:regulator of sigma E protease